MLAWVRYGYIRVSTNIIPVHERLSLSSLYPIEQEHSKPPSVLMHLSFWPQTFNVVFRHSFISGKQSDWI